MQNTLENMANTSSRTLRLLSLLQTHRYWPGSELADRLEVSVRTLRRDIERLRDLGYPVSASRGVDGGYQLAAGAALPPLVLDDEEAVAIVAGLPTGEPEIDRCCMISENAPTGIGSMTAPTTCRRPFGFRQLMNFSQSSDTFTVEMM